MKYIKIKTIYTIIFLFSFLFAESYFFTAFRDGRSISLSSEIHQWEYNEINTAISLYYISKPVNFFIYNDEYSNVVGLEHFFFLNRYMLFSLEGQYWKNDLKDVYWRGPVRKLSFKYTNQFEEMKNIDFFWSITRSHYNTNFGYWDSTFMKFFLEYSINTNLYLMEGRWV